ncbi:MAG: hypothetical protein IH987_12465 [Planctomycetes bacterium]|nr:hypothetical protein [Planctomycetota bacterium]
MTVHGCQRVILPYVATILFVSSLACHRDDPGDDRHGEAAALATKNLSPIDTLRLLRAHRAAGRFDQLGSYLLPEQRRYVIDLIHAVDRLDRGNDVLQGAVTRRFGPATARMFDRSGTRNAIGVFSADVKLLTERVSEDAAVVVIQVADRVPLIEVHLERRADRWVLRTDPPIPGMAAELAKLAEALVATARRLDQEQLTLPELRRELSLQEAAVGRRLEELTHGG